LFVHQFGSQNDHPISFDSECGAIVSMAVSEMVLIEVFHCQSKNVETHIHLTTKIANPCVKGRSGFNIRWKRTSSLLNRGTGVSGAFCQLLRVILMISNGFISIMKIVTRL
jgi:hypothetical protein